MLTDFQPAGDLSHWMTRGGVYGPAFRSLLASATHVGLVHRVPKAGLSPSVLRFPSKKLLALSKAFLPFRSVLPNAIEAILAPEWPGTRTKHPDLWIRAPIPEPEQFADPDRFLWSGWNGWEDLELFAGRRLLLWTCTHEREGEIFGDAAFFAAHKLAARPAVSTMLSVSGEPLDPVVLDAVVRGTLTDWR